MAETRPPQRHCFCLPSPAHTLHSCSTPRALATLLQTMSSPASHRSNRNSINGTPRRRGTRNPEAPMSDAPDSHAADDQLQSEASQALPNVTPRANPHSSQDTSQSQAPPTSSPLFFRSSPAGSQSQSQSQSLNIPDANGANVSSPLRQRNNAPSSEAGRTPRASGGLGGESGTWDLKVDLLMQPYRLVAYPLCA